jgi:hypothetical protein
VQEQKLISKDNKIKGGIMVEIADYVNYLTKLLRTLRDKYKSCKEDTYSSERAAVMERFEEILNQGINLEDFKELIRFKLSREKGIYESYAWYLGYPPKEPWAAKASAADFFIQTYIKPEFPGPISIHLRDISDFKELKEIGVIENPQTSKDSQGHG